MTEEKTDIIRHYGDKPPRFGKWKPRFASQAFQDRDPDKLVEEGHKPVYWVPDLNEELKSRTARKKIKKEYGVDINEVERKFEENPEPPIVRAQPKGDRED